MFTWILKCDPANVVSWSSSEHAPFYNKDHCRIFDASHSHGYTRYTVLAPTRLLISNLVRLHQRVSKSIHIHTSCLCYYYQFAATVHIPKKICGTISLSFRWILHVRDQLFTRRQTSKSVLIYENDNRTNLQWPKYVHAINLQISIAKPDKSTTESCRNCNTIY